MGDGCSGAVGGRCCCCTVQKIRYSIIMPIFVGGSIWDGIFTGIDGLLAPIELQSVDRVTEVLAGSGIRAPPLGLIFTIVDCCLIKWGRTARSLNSAVSHPGRAERSNHISQALQ